MTMHLKGQHADIIGMTYKSEGDGLQAYSFSQKVYTYQIFMCTDPAPKTYLDKSVSPLHAIFMALFGIVE